MKKTSVFPLLIFTLVLSLTTHTAYSAGQPLALKVTDISDRKYEQAVIELLDNAKSSIVISMYSINLGTKTNSPIKLLLNDLLEAREREVSVTLYLNTRFRDIGKAQIAFVESPIYNKLKDAGCIFYLMPSHRMLHDKLIIVDNRYVVEGSTNWSISALKNNFESATLIDSSDLAKVKLARLENLLTASKRQSERSYSPAYLENLPKALIIPKELLLNKEYFPKMVSNSDKRSLSLYLLLLAYSQTTVKRDFFVSLEAMALSLGMPDTWTYTDLRRQVIKSFKKLQYRYNLIEVEFFYGRDAAVRLVGIPGDSFSISSDIITNRKEAKPTMRLEFLLMIKALLKSEGEDLNSISQANLAKRFNVHAATIHAAFKDMRK